MHERVARSRRVFLKRVAGAGAGLFALACQPTPAAPTAAPKPTEAPKPAVEPAKPTAAPVAQPTAAPAAAPAAKVPLAPMRLGLQANVLAVPTKVAVDIGAFDKYGLKVEPIRFEAGGSIVRDAIVADKVELGTFFAATFIVGAATGRVSAYLTGHRADRAAGVMAKQDIRSVADLKGRKIGGGRGASTSQIFETKIAPANGLKRDDYVWVPLGTGGADQLGAYLAGTIDAYPAVEPYLTLGEKKGGAHLLTDYSRYDPMPIFVAGPTAFAEQNPDSVVALIRGWLDMAKFWQENPAKVFDIAKAYLAGGEENVEDDVLKTSLERVDLKPDLSPAVLDPYLKEMSDLLLQAGNIKENPNLSKTVRYDLWDKATKG
jgi:ABC-type nitrate/sulfonate/bicarbonate transport system substrate-binding protein